MAYVFKDLPNQNAPATLASAITSGATTIALTTGTGTLLPSPTGGDLATCRIEQELITYTTRTTDTLTGVTRGVGGTTAVAHSAGKQIRNVATAAFYNAAGGGSGASSLDGLSDVAITGTPAAGETLRSTGSGFVNAQLGHGDLSSVTATQHHSNTNDPSSGEKAALAGTSGTPGSGNKYVTDGDSRNTNSRTPSAHQLDGAAHTVSGLTTGHVLTATGATTFAFQAAGGGSSFAGARVRNSTDVNVPDSDQTVMPFDTEDFDTDAFHSTVSNTSRLVIPSGKAGKYHVGGSVKCSAQYGWVVLLKNGGYVASESLPGHAGPNGASLSTLLDLAEADYLELAIYQGSGGTLVSEAVSGATPCLWCYKVG